MQERRSVSQSGISQFFGRVYGNMGVGLLITAAITYLLGYVFHDQYVNFISSNPVFYWVMLLLPFVFIIFGSGARAYANPGRARLMFFGLAASEGTTMAVIMAQFSGTSVVAALVVTGVIFGTMSLVGIYGNKDLSRAGSIATTALVGALVMTVLNFLIHSSGLAMLINYAILAIFIVLVAYDNQTLKRFYAQAEAQGDTAISALAIQGALMLYLDFLNLFITILQIFGVGNDNN
ncbi:Bax inhibitor-1/YccA family protein [Lacticaseibacillus zhaodongensis]|uniref:Bax inhibitor-1/YccA family protein n=1 Tax=Lacticaseibacillus zhaodongensis TaxID=2668065 RepID=UPI0012D3326E|nr:Bax inhibitor-1/YccA family protein [Lacticaseibacillus zhaodongensis]